MLLTVGLMLLELWSQDDLYAQIKSSPLEHFLKNEDPGQSLLQCIKETRYASDYPQIVDRSLCRNHKERYRIKEWVDEWRKNKKTYTYENY